MDPTASKPGGDAGIRIRALWGRFFVPWGPSRHGPKGFLGPRKGHPNVPNMFCGDRTTGRRSARPMRLRARRDAGRQNGKRAMTNTRIPLLDRVAGPADLRQFSDRELARVADELRAEVIGIVSETGGHLGSSLGVVELTVALHAVFNTPMDKLIWDVGHQCYPHKVLTGRRDRMRTLRQKDGLSGFTKRLESVFDPFGAALAAPAGLPGWAGRVLCRGLRDRPGSTRRCTRRRRSWPVGGTVRTPIGRRCGRGWRYRPPGRVPGKSCK